ncbi:MAG: AmmeMemoRadiSam system protein B [Planctomycetes bacterium]|nr:AmmeMemoRadiSam system protein B [Planctomycetota bacterium]
MRIREPVVAGQFYAAGADPCRKELERLLSDAGPVVLDAGAPLGGLVPHAGWTYSGRVAAQVFSALAAKRSPEVVVLLGGVHRSRGREAALFADGRWETPLGPLLVDARLAERILGQTNLIIDDPYAHESEHSLEVQAPIVAHLFPGAKILPLMVPPTPRAGEVGEAVGRTLQAYDYDAVVVGTTDLTHYGPHYGFMPQGVGTKANAWAMQVNDRRFVDLVCKLRGDALVAEAMEHKNACSSGAAAATVAAVRKLGATGGILLQHTTSSRVVAERGGAEPEDSVGYAGIVFV